MTGWQNLRALGALSGWWEEREVKRVLELVRLADRVHGKVRTYSHGMRQRLALAQALLPMPEVLLLDEPTNGLDPEGIHEFRATVLRLRDEHGLTILFNSHLLSEVEQLCDRCVILREGQKVYEGLLKRTESDDVRFQLQSPDMELAARAVKESNHAFDKNGVVHLTDGITGPELLAKLVGAGVRVESWTPQHKTLEDVYLELSGIGRKP
jgi:ABC-2 type transport system ATP-binding protein